MFFLIFIIVVGLFGIFCVVLYYATPLQNLIVNQGLDLLLHLVIFALTVRVMEIMYAAPFCLPLEYFLCMLPWLP